MRRPASARGGLLVLVLWGGLACANEGVAPSLRLAGAYVDMRAQALSNGLPVMDIEGDWQRGYRRRGNGSTQRAYQAVQAEAGVRLSVPWPMVKGAWGIGWLVRSEAFARASGDAAEVVQFYQARRDPPGAATFQPRANVMLWRGQGLAVHTPWLSAGLGEWQATMQWLSLQRLRRVGADGEVIYDGQGGYEHQLALLDDDSSAKGPFTAAPARRGAGHSLSLAWRWTPAQDWSLRIEARDVVSRLRWEGVNTAQASLTSRVASRTPEGYLDYKPALQGAYARKTVRWRIPATVQAEVAWQGGGAGEWRLEMNRRWGLQEAWMGWRSLGDWQTGLALEPRFKALRLQVGHGGFAAGVQADRLDRASRAASVWVSYVWLFPPS